MKTAVFIVVWSILLVGAIWQYVRDQSDSAAAYQRPLAVVSVLDGAGFRRTPTTFIWREAEAGDTLPDKAVFATGAKSSAVVSLKGGRKIYLAEQSQVELSEDEAAGREVLTVFRGSLLIAGKATKGAPSTVVRSGPFVTELRFGKGSLQVVKDTNADRVFFAVKAGASATIERTDGKGAASIKLGADKSSYDSRPLAAAQAADTKQQKVIARVVPAEAALDQPSNDWVKFVKNPPDLGRVRFLRRDGTPQVLELAIPGLPSGAAVRWDGDMLQVDGGKVRFPQRLLHRASSRSARLSVAIGGETVSVGSVELIDVRQLKRSAFVAVTPKSKKSWLELRPDAAPYVRLQGQSPASLLSHFDIVDVASQEMSLQNGWFFVKNGSIVGEANTSLVKTMAKSISSLVGADLVFKGKRSALMMPAVVGQRFQARQGKMYFLTEGFLVPVDWQLVISQPGAEAVLRKKRYFFSDRVEILAVGP